MISKYAGRCKACGAAFKAGDEINYSKELGATCIACQTSEPPSESDALALAERLGFRPHEEVVGG